MPLGEGTFEVWLVWSDRRVIVPPGISALAVLQEAGVPIDPGCMTGGCGSCVTPYVDGEVVHKDACLSASDRATQFCPCVSRANGTLTLPF